VIWGEEGLWVLNQRHVPGELIYETNEPLDRKYR